MSEKLTFALCDGAIEYLPGDRIAKIPEETGHHGIKRTHRLIQRPVHQVKRTVGLAKNWCIWLGIDCVLHGEPGAIDSPYDVGDAMWVKPSEKEVHVRTVTGVVSDQTTKVDGMSDIQ